MTPHLFIFGMGYSARRLADYVCAQGWCVSGTGRGGNVAFADQIIVRAALSTATHILSSVPPHNDGYDPVLSVYADDLRAAPARWVGYLSSTGVYGDTGGAWVDESTPLRGRRAARNTADMAWQALREDVRVFRLPGIYGPPLNGEARSALERVAEGKAHRVNDPTQVFSRVHVDDIVGGVVASFTSGPAGVYNLADDLPAPQNHVIEYACDLLGMAHPPLIALNDPALSPAARAFYAENRRVANGKAKRLLKWQPLYPDYRVGLKAISADRP